MRKLLTVAAVVLGLAVANHAAAQESLAAKTTRQKLKQKISVEFKEVGIKAALDDIKNEMDKPCNFKIDNTTGISNNTKVSYKAKNKTVEEILNDLSDKLECGWYVVSNASNNRVDGWVVMRKSSGKTKERGYEAGKDPKGKASLQPPPGQTAPGSAARVATPAQPRDAVRTQTISAAILYARR